LKLDRIVAIVRPFDKMQYVHIYRDGECQCSHGIPMDQFDERLTELAAQYNLSTIDIAGPEAFTQKLKDDIEKYNITKYSENKLEINLI
jgi:hypothetical protein